MISFEELQRIGRRHTDVVLSRQIAVYGDELIAVEESVDDEVETVGGVLLWVNTSSGESRLLSSSPLDWPEWYVDDLEQTVTLI
ncbi:hypothetical protein [Corynebacterium aurimucosum]